jgi:hypothetical protein
MNKNHIGTSSKRMGTSVNVNIFPDMTPKVQLENALSPSHPTRPSLGNSRVNAFRNKLKTGTGLSIASPFCDNSSQGSRFITKLSGVNREQDMISI